MDHRHSNETSTAARMPSLTTCSAGRGRRNKLQYVPYMVIVVSTLCCLEVPRGGSPGSSLYLDRLEREEKVVLNIDTALRTTRQSQECYVRIVFCYSSLIFICCDTILNTDNTTNTTQVVLRHAVPPFISIPYVIHKKYSQSSCVQRPLIDFIRKTPSAT